MAGLIQEDAIRSIRERASVVEVVSDVVALRRRGRSFTGLCPFHTEKTPSFTVSEERGFFHCFGCGEHGDVFAFVMKTQSLPFPDAVRRVAQRFGLPVPEEAGGSARRRSEPLVAMNDAASTFFRNALRGAAGAAARAYLQERGLGADVVERFGLGYAPASGEGLWRQLRAENFPVEDALTTGLVVRRGNGGLLDRFRDRVMFPITDPTGRVIAFGGRILPGRPTAGDPPPKYLNSPDSPLFHKGQTVYGLAQAREGIRKSGRVIVVEGYMDVIALAGAGITEATAPLGTALTADQLRVLRRFTESVIACFDGDAAGRRAAARSFPVFIEAGLWGRGIFLPEDTDPDSFVRAQGAAALEAKLASPEPLIEAWIEGLAGTNEDAVGRHAAAADEVVRLLKRVRNPHEYNALARLAGQRLGVGEALLRTETAPEAAKPAPSSRSASVAVGAPGVEELLIELMAIDAAVANRVRDENLVADFEDPQWRAVAEALLATAADVDRTAAVQALPREIRDRVVRRLIGDHEEGSREQEVADCIARIHARRRNRSQTRLREAIRAAESRGDAAAVTAALTELKHLTQKDRT
jgi:DNA primase